MVGDSGSWLRKTVGQVEEGEQEGRVCSGHITSGSGKQPGPICPADKQREKTGELTSPGKSGVPACAQETLGVDRSPWEEQLEGAWAKSPEHPHFLRSCLAGLN